MMNKPTTAIIKKRDYSDIAMLQDTGVLEDFLSEPLSFIAETMTGALGDSVKGTMVAGGRIVQALLKGMLFQQWAREFKRLRDTGKIPDDFADKKNGFQTWVELMSIIDEESPDASRLEALKAMFFAVNKVDIGDAERIVAYQLWLVTKSLSSGELLLLKAVYENRHNFPQHITAYTQWRAAMAGASGHSLAGLVDLYEGKLCALSLLTPRAYEDRSGISPINARLSDMGIRLCQNIDTFKATIEQNSQVIW